MHTSTKLLPPDFWPISIFLFCFVYIWLLIFLITRQFSGWRSFAERYPAQVRPTGSTYTASKYWVGKMPFYKNCVRIIFTDAGVYFYMRFFFRLFHPPFLLPWESVKRIEKVHGFFGSRYLLKIEDAVTRVQLELPEKVEHDLSRYYNPGPIDKAENLARK
jgi:hypothetical protein